MILQTPRLELRKLTADDYHDLAEILQDPETMYAYEGAFSDQEVQDWLDRQLERYHRDGIGLWAAVLRNTNIMVGQVGLTYQPVPFSDGHTENWGEIGYLLKRKYWHQGYATEAALGCQKYAFEILHCDCVCSIIRDTNISSQRVAQRGGMTVVHRFVKHYRGVIMPHLVYRITKEEYQAQNCSGQNPVKSL